MKEIQKIELNLENCDSIEIDRKFIGDFYLGKISSEILRQAMNSVCIRWNAEELYLVIKKEANNECSCWLEDKRSIFDRLFKYNDICGVGVTYEDGTYDYIFVPWGDGEDNNEYQTSKVSALGNLYIVVSKTTNVDEVYSDEACVAEDEWIDMTT